MPGFGPIASLAIGQVSAPATGKTVAAGQGSYDIIGTDAALKAARLLVAGAGSYAITGTNATLKHAYKVTAGAGSYAITGSDVSLIKSAAGAFTIAAIPGSYAITGTAATLKHAYRVSAGVGSYAITGSPVALTIVTMADLAASTVSTLVHSQHPVNCQLEGNVPIKRMEATVEWMPGRAGTKVTASTSGPRRLSGQAPSFTSVTRTGHHV